jgi:putative toxin-antitoxin system antitoxin component (TIGR02293 family)
MTALRKKFSDLKLQDHLSIVYTARKGVRPHIFYYFSDVVNMPEKNLAALLHIHPRTISNYRDQKKHLNPVEGEHLLKLINLFTVGEETFGNIDQFNQWLNQPSWLNKEKPMDWLDTPGGVDLVLVELNRLNYGYVV